MFEAFVNQAPTVAYMKDDQFRYVFLNQPFEEQLNVHLDWMMGKTDFEWLPHEIATQIRANDERVLAANHMQSIEEWAPRTDGKMLAWLSLKFPFVDGSGRRFLGGVSFDITDRKQAEQALARSEAALVRAQQIAHMGHWTWDVDTHEVTWSDEMFQIFGLKREEGAKGPGDIVHHFHPEDRAYMEANLGAMMSKADTEVSFEYRLIRTDGEVRHAHGRAFRNADSSMWTGITQDITDRKQTEMRLKQLSQELKQAQQIGNMGSFSRDMRTGHAEWSDEMYPIMGFNKEQGPAAADLVIARIPEEDRAEFIEQRQQVFKGGITEGEFRIRHANGEIRHISMRSHFDVDNQKLTGVVRDITSRRRDEALLAEAVRTAQAATQAKSQFLANMSHELRTPLNSVIGFADMLEAELYGPLNAKQRDYVETIRRNGQHLLALINEVLDLSKIEAGGMALTLETVDLISVLEEVIQSMQPLLLRKKVTVDLHAPQRFSAHADPLRTQQIASNLLSNALKFGPPGRPIRVEVRCQDEFAVVTITDEGPGIAAADQTKIFQEFVQLETGRQREHAGTGLGLPLALRLAELQGGMLWVRSVPGEGASFSFSVPLEAP